MLLTTTPDLWELGPSLVPRKAACCSEVLHDAVSTQLGYKEDARHMQEPDLKKPQPWPENQEQVSSRVYLLGNS